MTQLCDKGAGGSEKPKTFLDVDFQDKRRLSKNLFSHARSLRSLKTQRRRGVKD